jgi:hypothetical protein
MVLTAPEFVVSELVEVLDQIEVAAELQQGFCCSFSERSWQGSSRAWRDGIRRAR